jgi:hypothetical protein
VSGVADEVPALPSFPLGAAYSVQPAACAGISARATGAVAMSPMASVTSSAHWPAALDRSITHYPPSFTQPLGTVRISQSLSWFRDSRDGSLFSLPEAQSIYAAYL